MGKIGQSLDHFYLHSSQSPKLLLLGFSLFFKVNYLSLKRIDMYPKMKKRRTVPEAMSFLPVIPVSLGFQPRHRRGFILLVGWLILRRQQVRFVPLPSWIPLHNGLSNLSTIDFLESSVKFLRTELLTSINLFYL
jgi:hypothetical protein